MTREKRGKSEKQKSKHTQDVRKESYKYRKYSKFSQK